MFVRLIGILLVIVLNVHSKASEDENIIHLTPAGEKQITFHNIKTKDGLITDSIRAFAEDQLGYMWIASPGGLMRFDGVDFKYVTNNPADPQSISSSDIRDLLIDSNGMLWVATEGGGVNVIDPSTFEVTTYLSEANNASSLSSNRATALYMDSSGTIWVGTRKGLNRFNSTTNDFKRYIYDPVKPDTSLVGGTITDMFEDPHGMLWVARTNNKKQYKGISVLNQQTDEFKNYIHDENDPFSLQQGGMQKIFLVDNQIWINSLGGGLSRYDESTDRFIRYKFTINERYSSSDHELRSTDEVLVDRNGTVWVTTSANGLLELDLKSLTGIQYLSNEKYDFHLCGNSQLAIFEDSRGNIWTHQRGCGIGIFNPDTRKFNSIYPLLADHEPNIEPNAFNTKFIAGNKIAFGEKAGLYLYDISNRTFTNFISTPYTNKKYNPIRSIFQMQNGSVLSSVRFGVMKYEPNFSDSRYYEIKPPKGRKSVSTGDVFEAADGTVYLLVSPLGLARFDPETGGTVNLGAKSYDEPLDVTKLSHTLVTGIDEDKNGHLWITTYNGLNRYNPETGLFKHYVSDRDNPKSIPESRLHSLNIADDGTIWIGSNSGLISLNPETEQFEHYMADDGISRNQVYCVRAIDNYVYYMTYEANARWHITDKRSEIFTIKDGQSGYIAGNHESCDISPNGDVVFGTKNGLTYFNHYDLQFEPKQYTIALTELKIDDSVIQPTSETIELPHTSNLIQVAFRALEFYAPENIKYHIKLENFDDDWRDIGRSNQTAYTNLDHGMYTFKIRASNQRGDVTEKTLFTVNKAINPYYSPFAYIIYAFIIISLVSIYIVQQRRKVAFLEAFANKEQALNAELRELQKHMQEVREEERTSLARELHDELAQVLVAIKLELSWVKSALDKREFKGAAERLPEVNNIVETGVQTVRKIASGLRPSLLDDLGLVAAIEQYMHEVCERAQINTRFSTNCEKISLAKELEINLYRIVQESLTNVLKHSKATQVDIAVILEYGTLSITIADNGIGLTEIDKTKQGHFGLIGIRERVSSFKGKLKFDHNEPKGLKLLIVIPAEEMKEKW